ncbi:MAG: helix-turn-helix domain-containing protein, partial [Desulfobacteraceae bacterium]
MDSKEFVSIRKKLDKTQTQMAQLLGTSVKAVYSYEQGWRNVPSHVERQLFFLLSRTRGNQK